MSVQPRHLAAVLSVDHAELAVLVHMTPDVLDGLLALVVDADMHWYLLTMIPHFSVQINLQINLA